MDNKILVRYTEKTSLTRKIDFAMAHKVSVWCKGHIAYDIEWAYINGWRVGLFLEPQDATLFRLIFKDDILER